VSELTTQPLTDVHDMVVVHRVFRRELRLLPELVRAVPAGDTARAAVLARHARLVCAGLHMHHTGEDEVLWPLLLDRAAPSSELVYRMESQHHRVEDLLARLTPALERWQAEARPAVSAEVAATIDDLRTALLEHLDDEEAHILPIAARCVSQQEWDSLGERGLGEMPKAQLPLLCWMILEDASADERAALLANIPAPMRFLLRTIGARKYRSYVARVRGT
jgi:hemerythrin-like domain-containing protein